MTQNHDGNVVAIMPARARRINDAMAKTVIELREHHQRLNQLVFGMAGNTLFMEDLQACTAPTKAEKLLEMLGEAEVELIALHRALGDLASARLESTRS